MLASAPSLRLGPPTRGRGREPNHLETDQLDNFRGFGISMAKDNFLKRYLIYIHVYLSLDLGYPTPKQFVIRISCIYLL